MARYEWLKRVERLIRHCPACRRVDWVPTVIEPGALLIYPGTPVGHPELEGGMDGKAVLPVTCKQCGFVATFSMEHLENVSPWE